MGFVPRLIFVQGGARERELSKEVLLGPIGCGSDARGLLVVEWMEIQTGPFFGTNLYNISQLRHNLNKCKFGTIFITVSLVP